MHHSKGSRRLRNGSISRDFLRLAGAGTAIDEGWKDPVLVMPGERVGARMTFRDHAELFRFHCHDLEREDQGMMRNFRIEAR